MLLDAGCLDHLAPFLEFGVVELREFSGAHRHGDGAFGQFGSFGAALVQELSGSTVVGGVAGLGFGVVAAAGTVGLTRLVKEGASDGTLTAGDSRGRSGRVISAIPADGLGTIRLAIGGHTVQLSARSDHPVEPGTEVHVTEILSPTSVRVAPVWNELPGPDVNPGKNNDND